MLIEGMEKQDSSFHKYYMSRAEEKACFVPFGGKASGPGFPGTWVQKVHRRAISELSGGVQKDLAGGGGMGVGRAGAWATFTACDQGLRSYSAPLHPPSASPKSYSFLPASPQEISAPARRSPPPAPAGRGAGGGAGGGSGRSGKLADFFPLGDPLTTSPPRSTQVSLAGLRREGLSWGRARVWLRSSPA